MPSSMLDFLSVSNVPPLVWSGVGGAFVAFLGVFMANWQNRNRQRDQHVFDTQEKRRDRIIALRKDVYLPLVGAMQEAQSFLGTLTDVDEGSQEPITRFSVAVAKLAIVAEMPTAMIANRVSSELSTAYYNLLREAHPCREAKKHADETREYRLVAEVRSAETQQKIDNFLATATANKAVFDILLGLKKRDDDLADGFRVAENAALQLEAIHRINYLRLLTEKMAKFSDSGFELLVAVRRDFELSTDEPSYLASLTSERDAVIVEMDGMIDNLEKLRRKNS